MSTKEIKDFIFENYFTHFGFTKKTVIIQRNIKKKKKKILSLATKLFKKCLSDASNAKEYYELFLKNKKMVKPSKIITQQPQSIENANIIDMASVTIEHPQTSYKLSKVIR